MTPHRVLPALALTALLALTACDSSGPQDASITIALGAVTADGQCDNDTNPGDFQFQIEVADLGDSAIQTFSLPEGATYGVWDADDLAPLFRGEQLQIGRTVSFQQPREAGSGFTVTLGGMEWDTETTRDPRLDDARDDRTHLFVGDQFQNVAGTQELTAGSSTCSVTLDYDISVQ